MKRFDMGRTVMTAGVADRIDQDAGFARHVLESMARYAACDWGDLGAEDAGMNDSAVKNGDDRILAVYEPEGRPGDRIWIITEWDRSATTILFPEEY